MLCLPSPRKVLAFVGVIACAGLVAASPALASSHHRHHHHGSSSSQSSETSTDANGAASGDSTDAGDAGAPVTGGTIPTGTAQTITADITGFSFQDNTPPSSATVCCSVLHKVAGGQGTYADPITTAVPGHSGSGMETAKGTRIYVAKVKRYFIVEDSGATKMSGKHFDLWVGGQGFSKSSSDKCMNSYTGKATVILNPPAGEPVTVGPLTGSNGCRI